MANDIRELTVAEKLRWEESNRGELRLHSEGKYLVAYERSAYLLETHLWPGIKVIVKTLGNPSISYVRAGFPVSSWAKVKQAVGNKKPAKLCSLEDGVIIVRPLALEQGKFSKWKEGYLSLIARAQEKLRSPASKIPLFIVARELFKRVMYVDDHLKPNWSKRFGSKLVDKAMKLLELAREWAQFYQCRQQQTLEAKQLVSAMMKNLAELAVILDLAYDERALSGQNQLINLSSQIEAMRCQLTALSEN